MPTNTGSNVADNLVDSLTFKGARDKISHALEAAKSALGMSSADSSSSSSQKPDTSWHDQKVNEANESFRKAAEAEKKPVPKYKHGTDNVPETGPAILHKGEAVLPKHEADKYRAAKDGDDGDHGMSEDDHVSLHRALNHLNKGGLHRALGVKEGEPIPADKLEAAKNSSNPHIKHMALFASVLKGFHHKGE